ncbi:MAG: bifunctional ornithine acetyltransferase/N-acetylglutamate synthase [Spirochaetes bacterium]|nr:bifunctional ornithine acetyltransferase/N-acetylglutamate synthase [Spirochaetota bacterium]
MEILTGGLENVPGYVFSAVECGIKYQNRLDLSLIASEKPCHAAGVFTTNRVYAAPVRLCRERTGLPVRGILVNATNANACTGDEGYANARRLTRETARLLGAPEDSILMASTGVIGVQLPAEKMQKSLPALVEAASPSKGGMIAKAIMTTDTFAKEYAVRFDCDGAAYIVAGTAKGAGMMAPNMATLLAFLLTDMPLAKNDLDAAFRRCTSSAALASFEEALLAILKKLAELLVRDGEGATKFVRVVVKRAADEADARLAARAVAQSLLVKTALFGNDPNWGRIACAAGYSGARIDEKRLSILIDDAMLLSNGTPVPFERAEIQKRLAKKDLEVTVDLGMGDAGAECLTTDLSYDYVKINAEYTT